MPFIQKLIISQFLIKIRKNKVYILLKLKIQGITI